MTTRSAFPLSLFAFLMREAPAQPATNLWRAVELTALINHALPLLQNCLTMLDLGCGDGGVMTALRKQLLPQVKLIGLDPDPAETRIAEQRGLYVRVLTSGAENMPLDNTSVDAIISNSVLEHITPIDDVLKESCRVLCLNGLFVATVPSADFHRCLLGPWLPWVSREAYRQDLDARLFHHRYWTKDEWREKLAKAGLTLVATHDYLPLAVARRWELLSRLTGGLLYHLAGRKKPPLRLQRDLGLRRRTLPWWLAKGMAWFLSRGLGKAEAPYGGLLVVARKYRE